MPRCKGQVAPAKGGGIREEGIVTCPASAGIGSGGAGVVRQLTGILGIKEPRIDLTTKKQLLKTIRALRLVVAKRTANTIPLFGAGSKTMSLEFVLKRSAEKTSNAAMHVQVSLPSPLFAGRSAEGLCLKIAHRRVLVVQFGWCNMEEDTLVKNALAVLDAVDKTLEKRCVQEIKVREIDGLALPVWNIQTWERAKKRSSSRVNSCHAKRPLMPPPKVTPRKKQRVEPSDHAPD
eukprot:TRINITY_DN15935_c0_g1_i1.p1 TRINITY_DN15935_c0_g1~~TRINITY_DN15935_c0_g1_i1.p1  ORF type:complete len:234 (-),score=34.87 TRINITY_DN15935_c0_g1_i1:132-833(-)